MKRFAWWNHYGSLGPASVTARALAARLDCVIIKAGFSNVRNTLIDYGIPWATEIYAYPSRIDEQVALVKHDISAHATSVVINAEVEWEETDAPAMTELIRKLRGAGAATLYACTDTRGDRMAKPYQRVMAALCDGWMPMIYPGAFQQTTARAFAASLDERMGTAPNGINFRGKPVIPAIQTYGGIGAASVTLQIAECERRRLAGFGAYTIGHATAAEWDAVAASAPVVEDKGPDIGQLNKAGDIFATCTLHALRGEQLPAAVAGAARWLMQ